MDGRRPEPSYYAVLGVRPDATSDEIRRAYRKLAMKWHPDRWRARQSDRLLEEANRKFQSIQEAYRVLSDRSKRMLYDAGMYDEEEEEVEGFAEFVEEMVELMADLRREKGVCGLPELRSMLDEMARSFQLPPTPPPPPATARWADGCVGGHETRGSKRVRTGETGSYPHHVASGLGLFGSASCC